MGLKETLTLSNWYIATNKDDVIFELKEPAELLKRCRNIQLKDFFCNIHYRLLGSLLASGCIVGVLIGVGVAMAIVMVIIKLFLPDFNPGEGSKDGKDMSGWGILWFMGALIVAFTFIGLVNELAGILFTRFIASTASFRNQGLLVYGGVSHAEWEEITGVTLYREKDEPDYVFFDVTTSKEKTPRLQFVLIEKDATRATEFFAEREIPCESMSTSALIDRVMRLKEERRTQMPVALKDVVIEDGEEQLIELLPSTNYGYFEEAVESATRSLGDDGASEGCSRLEPSEKLSSMQIHIDDVSELLELDVPQVKTVCRLDGEKKVKCDKVVAYGACDNAVVFFECHDGIVQRAWCRLRVVDTPEEDVAEEALYKLGGKWELLIVDWQNCSVCKLSEWRTVDKYLRRLEKMTTDV